MNASWVTCPISNVVDHTALASFTSDASLLAGGSELPVLWQGSIDGPLNTGKVLEMRASGIVSCTSTPTYTFTVRAGTTDGSSYLSGTTIAASAAITCGSGITNKWWEMVLWIVVRKPGRGAATARSPWTERSRARPVSLPRTSTR